MTFTNLALFLAFCSLISVSKSEGDSRIKIQVQEDSLFIGDRARFICSVPDSDFENSLQWTFENKDGTSVTPHASPEYDVTRTGNGEHFRQSVLTVTNASSVTCSANSKSGEVESSSRMITVNNVSPVSTIDGSHKCRHDDVAPKIILWRLDETGFDSRFWSSHIVTDSKVHLSDKVSRFRLICQHKSPVHWIIDTYNLRPYLLRDICAEEILEVYPISKASSREYICSANSTSDTKSSSVFLQFPKSLPPPSPLKRIYDNETMDAIESIVETFDSSKAVGVGFGSSAGSIVMMIAILFLKKTLQRRRAAQNGSP